MYRGMTVGVAIPARDEAGHIAAVVAELLALRGGDGGPVVDHCVVCDNGSADGTAAVARRAGGLVVAEPTPGYGSACLAALAAMPPVDVVLFTDGDGSFRAAQAPALLDAIAAGADLAIGSRRLGQQEPGALSIPQRLGNRVAAGLIWLLWRRRITDLGPYRAIRAPALDALGMRDRAFGWTVEMQVKAIIHQLRMVEVPVDALRRRLGRSKVGGTWRGVLGASLGILGQIAHLRLTARRRSTRAVGDVGPRRQ